MKISRGSYWLKAGSYSFLQNISNLIFGFGSFFLLVRMLSKEDFGIWVLFITISAILEMIRQSLLRNGLIMFLAHNEREDEKDIRVASLVLNMIITVFGVVVIALSAKSLSVLWSAPELKNILYIFCITALILIPFSHLEYLFQAKLNFKGIFIGNLLRNGFFFVFVALAYGNFYQAGIDNLIIFHLTAACIGSLTYILLSRRDLIGLRKVKWKYVVALFNYGKYVLGTGLSAILNTSVDQFMIGYLMSTVFVAIYNASNRVVTLVSTPSTVIASIVFPKSAEIGGNNDLVAMKDLYEKSLAVNMAIIMPPIVFIICFPSLVINIVAGAEYLEAVPVLRAMMLIALFIPPARLFGTILDSLGRPQINFYVTSVSAITNVGLNYILILKYGVIGAVYGSVTVLFIAFVIMQIMLKKRLNIKIRSTVSYIWLFYVDVFKNILSRLRISG